MQELHPAVQAVLTAWRHGDVDTYVDAFADDFTLIDPYGGATTRAELRGHIDLLQKTWTDLDYVLTSVVGDDINQAFSYTMSLTGVGMGFEGKSVSLPAMVFVETEGDKIKLWNECFDTAVFRRARSL